MDIHNKEANSFNQLSTNSWYRVFCEQLIKKFCVTEPEDSAPGSQML